MDFAITKVSTKGQIVIPSPLRKGIHTGDEFLMIKDNNKFVMKNMKEIAMGLKDDFKFAERVEKAWQEFDKGKFEKKSKKDFLNELKSC